MTQSSLRTERAISSFSFKPWRLIGFGYYQAWIYLAVLSTVLFTQSDFFEVNTQFTRQYFSLSLALCLLCLIFFSKKLDILNRRHYLLTIAATLTALGTIIIAFPIDNYSLKFTAVTLGITLTSLGNSILIISWGMLWSTMDVDRLCLHLVVSNVFAGCVYLVVVSLPAVVAIAITALLPVFSILTLRNSTDEPPRKIVPPSTQPKKLLYKAIAAIALIPLIFGISRALSSSLSYGSFALTYFDVLVGMTILSFFVAIFVAIAPKGQAVTRLYRFVVPLMAIGFLCLPFVPDNYLWLGFAAIMCGFYSFEGLVWLLQPEYILKTRANIIKVFGWGRALFHLFGFIGVTIGFFLINNGLWNDQTSIAICIIAVLMLIAVATYLFTEHDLYLFIKPPTQPVENVDTDSMLKTFAKQHCLSKREQEIFILLAKGRSAPFIADELYIAKGTVKTHTRHIYEKLGIHDKQELLNLIEAYKKNG